MNLGAGHRRNCRSSAAESSCMALSGNIPQTSLSQAWRCHFWRTIRQELRGQSGIYQNGAVESIFRWGAGIEVASSVHQGKKVLHLLREVAAVAVLPLLPS